MPFDKGKFVSDFTDSGMEEAQAELLADNQASLLGQLAEKQDIAELQEKLSAERRVLDEKISDAADIMRREVNDQTQKTRLLIDDVQSDVKKTEARLEGLVRSGFAMVNSKFNVLALSNTAVIISVIGFMYFLMQG